MLVSDFIETELESYKENKQYYMIIICEDDKEIAHEWIQNFKDNASQYMDKRIKKIEYYTESAYVYII